MKKNWRRRRLLIAELCLLTVLIAGLVYMVCWFTNQNRVQRQARRYDQLYPAVSADLPQPTAVPQSLTATPAPLEEVYDRPLGKPDGDTLVLTLPTPPPVQESFAALLKVNSDTVGYLRLEGLLSMPVVQRENDNATYLDHNFEGEPAREGTVFMDGLNRLVPEDDCLILYGHNMQDGTMFGQLSRLADPEFLREHPILSFDTIYENRRYVPFAVAKASMEQGRRALDFRSFIFDTESFALFLRRLDDCAVLRTGLDVVYGDSLLLLVTCEYDEDDGRLIVACRRLRENEDADILREAL